jgi:acyl-CoA reductase-like NAD-dependent aldehyde dehydrogenase
MRITNPATNELIKEIAEDTAQNVEAKYQRAKGALSSWSQVAFEKRIALIQRFGDLLDQNKDNLAQTLTLEVGKPLQESYNEINGARGRIKFYIENAQNLLLKS